MQHYVLLFVLNPATQQLVTLTKQSGPAFLKGKLTVPGGKREEVDGKLEEVAVAATRELREETGLSVDQSAWLRIGGKKGEWGSLEAVLALSNEVHTARTMELEAVSTHTLDELEGLPKESLAPDLLDYAALLRRLCPTSA